MLSQSKASTSFRGLVWPNLTPIYKNITFDIHLVRTQDRQGNIKWVLIQYGALVMQFSKRIQ